MCLSFCPNCNGPKKYSINILQKVPFKGPFRYWSNLVYMPEALFFLKKAHERVKKDVIWEKKVEPFYEFLLIFEQKRSLLRAF